HFAQIPFKKRRTGHHATGSKPFSLDQAFIEPEHKCFVLDDWPARASAVLMPPVLRLTHPVAVVEEIVRVKLVIPQEFEKAAMDLIGTRFGDQVDGRASHSSECGRKDGGLNLKFLNAIDRR